MGSFPLYGQSANIVLEDAGIRDTTLYKLDGVDGVEYPNGSTKLCLSCHDGATALGELASGKNIAMTANYITDVTKIFDPLDGTTLDFAQTHPVSFVYNDTVAAYINTNGINNGYVVPDPDIERDVRLDSQSRMQCTTCHNPHHNSRGASGYNLPFWAKFTGASNEDADYNATCVQCHTGAGAKTGPPNDGHNL